MEDVLSRRSRSLLFNAQASMSAAPRVAALMATELHWTPAKTTHEIDHFQKLACGYILEGRAVCSWAGHPSAQHKGEELVLKQKYIASYTMIRRHQHLACSRG